MSVYQCFFTRDDTVPTLKVLESARNGEAVAEARKLLELGPADLGLEVWKDEKLVVRVARPR